ncbi:fibronectin-like [Clavelina lepadiformis]|uniref:fibronectin-like n=1 Tax=Clavelina lepadiformis TaxID=159417 RepID=UPI00404255BA
MMKLTLFLIGLFCLTGSGISQRLPTVVGRNILSRTPTTVQVEWRQPPGVTYAQFNVRIRPRARIGRPSSRSQTSRTFSDLRPGMRYTVSIVGVTERLQRSPPLTFPLWSQPLSPSNLRLRTVSEVMLSIQLAEYDHVYTVATVGLHADWDAAEGMIGSFGYDVRISPKHGTELYPQELAEDDLDGTSRVFTGLTPGEEYTVSVRTKAGFPFDLVFSEPVSMNVVIPPIMPFTVDEIAIGATTAQIRAIGPMNGIHDKLVFQMEPDGGEVGGPEPDPVYQTYDMYSITNLTPSTSYTIDVFTSSQGVLSEEPFTIRFKTKPAAPMGLEATDFDMTSVELQWEPPANVMEGDVTQYVIEYIDIRNPEEVMSTETGVVPPGGQLVHTRLRGLTPGVTYKLMVFSVTDDVRSEVQAELTITTVPPKPTVTLLNVTDDGLQVLVEGPPPDEGECPFVRVSLSPGEDGKQTRPLLYETGSTIFFHGTNRNTLYTIHARCVSNNVESEEDVEFTDILSGSRGPDDTPAEMFVPCLIKKVHPGPTNPDTYRPDACCGDLPYHSAKEECCGGIRVQKNGERLCCGERPYRKDDFVCCGDDLVHPKIPGCPSEIP